MSVVAVKVTPTKITIGADSQTSWAGNKSTDSFGVSRMDMSPKIFKVNGIIIGGAGTAEELNLMRVYASAHTPTSVDVKGILEFMVEFHEWLKDKESKFDYGNHYIFVYQKKAFRILDLDVVEVENFTAVGSGMFSALTALYLGKSVKESLQITSKLNLYCSEPITIYEVSLNNGKKKERTTKARK